VQVLPAPFTITGLNRQRTVRLYLPPSYNQGEARYPVVYMHDGQNLFDAATAYAGEWGVDETLNEMAQHQRFEAIVVGIDNGREKRMNELNPYDHAKFGPGEGRAYLNFLVGTLKPWVDRHYRTLPGRGHTAVVGISMGGVISHAAILDHPQVFGMAGVLSPAYWTAPALFDEARLHPLPADARIYLSMGELEGPEAMGDVADMATLLGRQAAAVTLHKVPGAQHNEAAWRAEFQPLLSWLFQLAPGADQ
jgi:predicted alpha/beta superfamily hydrolase